MKTTLVGFLITAVSVCTAQRLPQCVDPTNYARNSIVARATGTNNITYATYQFRDRHGNPAEPDPAIRAAVQAAAKQWNDLARNGGIQFIEYSQPPPSNISVPDIFIQPGSVGVAGGCALTAGDSKSIYYSARLVQAANSNPQIAAWSFAHELGHMQRLPDAGENPPQATVMNNPHFDPSVDPAQDPNSCADAKVNTMTVMPYDSWASHACYTNGQNLPSANAVRGVTKGEFIPSNLPNCSYTTITCHFFVDGQYDSSMDFVNSWTCN